MKYIAVATRLIVAASMMSLALLPMRAGAAGVYENAAAEPAFLLSPRQVALRGELDFSRNDPTEASIYRVGAAFPLRKAFMVGVEQEFVSVSDTTGIEGGLGNLYLRGSARVWGGPGWSLSLLGYLVTGTKKQEYFPYSSRTLDVNASFAWVDTLGDASMYLTAGRTWINRGTEQRPVDIRQADFWRASGGATIGGGDVRGRGGALFEYTEDAATRWILYGGVLTQLNDAIDLHGWFEKEVGKESQRVSDWAVSGGFTVCF